MIDVDEARRIVLSRVAPLGTQEVPLADGRGRTLARAVRSDVDDPPFDRSVMDGFAVRAADVEDVPTRLRVVGQIGAGSEANRAIEAKQAMQINTGAPIPAGADAVVRVEHTHPVDGGAEVEIRQSAEAGKFITRRAAHISAGGVVIEPGTVLGPAEIGAAAGAGASRVVVHRRPRAAVLVTGNELVGVDQVPRGPQIRNSNAYVLSALLSSAGVASVDLGIAGDALDELEDRIRIGLQEPVLCITGGISMGAFDFVPEVLERCGVTFHIRKMRIKPGRPVIFGMSAEGSAVFALPGNPVSAMVAFVLLVEPALTALQGRKDVPLARVRAVLGGVLGPTTDRRTFRPGKLTVGEDGLYRVMPVSWRGSGDLFGMVGSNALIEQAPDSDGCQAGDEVRVIPMGGGAAKV
ncbi:MAG: gephyrin-like molybdotransferase Glp [Phycisphaerae bacterium]